MTLTPKKLLLIFAILIECTTSVFSQSLSDSLTKKIDDLYAHWNKTNSPGCAIGIVRNDTLIYSKGYGMANLEYDIINSPETVFHMASISKQFTAWSIIMLAKQGKLGLDDDIRKYLPWFPDLKVKITIGHLLNHTSGIRDQWQLLAISGTRLDDVITQEHIVKILSKQQALNFQPGEQYSYSNSGFTMLAEIVKSVTGKTLREFTDSAIFKPLGMAHMHFHDDYTEIEKNRAYSYGSNRNDFANSILSYSNAGATSLFTNINDLSKWVMNFYNPRNGDKQDIETLTKNGRLNSGKEIPYANGIIADTYKGWRQFSHGGADAGYRTYLSVFPDLKMGFMVFSNLGNFDTRSKAMAMADLFIKDTTVKKAEVKKEKRDSTAAVITDTLGVKKFTGDYMGEDGLPINIEVKRSKLYYSLPGQNAFLMRDSKDSFSIAAAPEIKFVFNIKAKDTLLDVITPDQQYKLKKYIKDVAPGDKLLQTYEGTYYSPELDCSYHIVLKGGQLFLTHAKYNDAKLTLLNKDHLVNDNWWINHLNILRDGKNNINGFEVNSGRVMHVRFNKVGK